MSSQTLVPESLASSARLSLADSTGSGWLAASESDADSPFARSSPTSSSSRVSNTTSKPSRKRIRPKIDLAPGQPPTARGNDRVRVHVACFQCRARKIRCDGAKPVCINCQRQVLAVDLDREPCSYDTGPKRRGRAKGSVRSKDSGVKMKGAQTRQRLSPNDEAQTQSESDKSSEGHYTLPESSQSSLIQAETDSSIDADLGALLRDAPQPELELGPDLVDFPADISWDLDPMLYGAAPLINIPQILDPAIVITPPEQDYQDEEQENHIPSRPSTQFARDTWWDALLTFYANDFAPLDGLPVMLLTHSQRSAATELIVQDLHVLFQASPCWLGFFDLPRFFETLFDPARRNSLQPSFLMSALAMGKLAKSSEVEEGAKGRHRALTLLQMAHGALEGSLATGWVDVGLAHASLLIVYFEMHSHPMQTLSRTRSALLLLDSLMRLFSLTMIDEDIRPRGRSPYAATRPAVIHPTAPPNFATPPSSHYGLQPGPNYPPHTNFNLFQVDSNLKGFPIPTSSHQSHQPRPTGCNCLSMTLGQQWPEVRKIAPSWAGTVMWPQGLSEGDHRREECRRFVWSCVMATATMSVYTSALPETISCGILGRLFVREPENFALLMPGEVLASTVGPIEMDDICSLNLRTMLLMHLVLRTREDNNLSPAERAQMAVQAWLEVDDIEARMARHTCDLSSTFGYEGKEMLFLLRMLTSYDFQQFIPQIAANSNRLFYRDKAEEWLEYIEQLSEWVWGSVSIGTLSATQDHRKSLLLFWSISSIRRTLVLWERDNGLMVALTVAKKIAVHVEYGILLWPNIRLKQSWQNVRYLLVSACLKAGVPPPSHTLPRLPIPGPNVLTTVPSSAES